MSDEELNIKDQIKGEYLQTLLKTGKEPITAFAFAEELGISEEEFYQNFRTFKSVEKEIWRDIFLHVLSALEADTEFPNYTGREKVLSFFYTLVEVFKLNRSLVMFRLGNLPRQNMDPWFLEKFKGLFLEFLAHILEDSTAKEEIVARPYISDKYKDAMWFQVVYISRLWTNDESDEYQITDQGIEKSVNLAFELMRKGPVDLMVDFAKFVYQNKAY